MHIHMLLNTEILLVLVHAFSHYGRMRHYASFPYGEMLACRAFNGRVRYPVVRLRICTGLAATSDVDCDSVCCETVIMDDGCHMNVVFSREI